MSTEYNILSCKITLKQWNPGLIFVMTQVKNVLIQTKNSVILASVFFAFGSR